MTNTGCSILHVYFHTHFSLISIVLGHGSLSIPLHCTVPITSKTYQNAEKNLKKFKKWAILNFILFRVPAPPLMNDYIDIRLKVANNPKIQSLAPTLTAELEL